MMQKLLAWLAICSTAVVSALAFTAPAPKPLVTVLCPGTPPRLLDKGTLDFPVGGIVLRAGIDELRPTATTTNYARLDAELKVADKAGKPAALCIFYGPDTPAYVKCQRFDFYDDHRGGQADWSMPVPYTPEYLAYVTDSIKQLAWKFKDRKLAYVHISGVSRFSAELHLPSELRKVKGYQDQYIIDAHKTIAATYAKYFTCPLVLDVSVLYEGAGVTLTKQIIEAVRGVVGDKRLILMHCALRGDTTDANQIHTLVKSYAGKCGIGFEFLQPSNHPKFSGTFAGAMKIATDSGASIVQVYQGDVSRLK